MVAFRLATLLLLAGVVASEPVTPIQKVITLLEDLKAEVAGDGEAEAATYDEFACFCKDTTEKKSGAITQGQDDIEQLSADIQAKTAEKAEKLTEVEHRQTKQEELAKELEDTKARCLKEKMEYEATSADLSKAISSLEGAIKVLEVSKPTAAALISIRESVDQSLALADALNLVQSKKQQAVTAFLQVDPNDPEYKYHSQGIIAVLEKLLTDFRAQKAEVDAEFEKAKKACDDLKASLAKEMDENEQAIKELKESIEKLKVEIAQAREDLVNAEGMLKDDQLF
jgi:chromosome segregation ATPase